MGSTSILCAEITRRQINIRIGDQSDLAFLQSVVTEFGPPDVVIDDGSHVMKDLAATFTFLYPGLDKNGVYFVEDLHTAYWKEFGGGLHKPENFIEVAKDLVDELNAQWTRGALHPTPFTNQTASMHFYDSIIVFERAKRLPAFAPHIGEGGKVHSVYHGEPGRNTAGTFDANGSGCSDSGRAELAGGNTDTVPSSGSGPADVFAE